ncbi:MAG: tetraacyldisaccharide 4'-kinase [Acidithiobacillales bacterium]
MTASRLLVPFATLYGAGVAARLALYRAGVLRVRRAARPVVSVGNVAVGGTGKTPFVRWLAGELLARGERPVILTRGYGRRSRGLVVVSDGAGTLAPVSAAGDEPAVLARALPRVPVIADASRWRAARRALEMTPDVSLFLLDDGFSHVGLFRDVDVVLLDASAPDAGGDLLPAGRLREPLSAMARADLIVVTRSEKAGAEAAAAIASRHAPGVPVFHAVTAVVGIRGPGGGALASSELKGVPLVAVAGLARPDAFSTTLGALGVAPVALLPFRDHARFGAREVDKIVRTAASSGAGGVITTEKDAVKLESVCPLPLYVVAIEMRVVEPAFLGELHVLLARRPS